MDRGAWRATVRGAGRKRVRHDLATEQQQQMERINASRIAPLGIAFLAARSGPLTPTAPQHPGPEQALLGHRRPGYLALGLSEDDFLGPLGPCQLVLRHPSCSQSSCNSPPLP